MTCTSGFVVQLYTTYSQKSFVSRSAILHSFAAVGRVDQGKGVMRIR